MTRASDTTRRSAALGLTLLCLLQAVAGAAGTEAGARKPVLLELFTSEGCSSCPPADALLETLDRTQPVDGAELIVLSEHVDYWNSLGWVDPFSSRILSLRQEEYATRFSLEGAYTPQLVVDGLAELVGSNAGKARAAIEAALSRPKWTVTFSHAVRGAKAVRANLRITGVGGAPAGATVYLAVAENQTQSSVGGGENAGRQLRHVAVVRTLMTAGKVGAGGEFSRDVSIPLGGAGEGIRLVAFVQDRRTKAVLGAAQQRL